MKLRTAFLALTTALLLGAAPAMAAPSGASRPSTPNSCIALNHGDFNACNVGNSGAGNLAYEPISPSRTPNECIALNQGDFNACNVGNSGGGELPYLPAR